MQPEVSVVMASAFDYDGPIWTIQTTRAMQDTTGVEFVVLDNAPDSPEGKLLAKNFRDKKFVHGTAGCTYIPLKSPMGTAVSRETAIRAASGKIVICCDSHIMMLDPKALSKLVRWFKARPKFKGIVSGPMFYDDLNNYETHFNPMWRGEMWGVWGQAFLFEGQYFSCLETPDNQVRYIRMDAGVNLMDSPVADRLPALPWSGHQAVLAKLGCKRLGGNVEDQFTIPGQGLWLFAFRKETWPGFNPHMRGFGGEEMYIHEKFRRQGGEVLSLGFMKGWHRFGRPNGQKYPLSLYDKVRNNVLTHLELGFDTEIVHEHFKDKFPAAQWDHIMANPIENMKQLTSAPTSVAKEVPDLEEVFNHLQTGNNYFTKHAVKLKWLSSISASVVEVSRYPETTTALLAGRPTKLHSLVYSGSDHAHYVTLAKIAETEGLDWDFKGVSGIPKEIPPCELLFYKTPHNCETLKADLTNWLPSLKERVLMHDVQRNGLRLDNQRPGYWSQIKDFLDENPNWFIEYYTAELTGLIVLSCNAENKPENEIIPWPLGRGPGTELKQLLLAIGIRASATCGCNKLANYMDSIGPDGCEKEMDKLKEWINENWEKWGWKDKVALVAAGTKSVFTGGDVWKLKKKTDPVGSLILLAISKSRETQGKKDA
jgi:hypothetical protein